MSPVRHLRELLSASAADTRGPLLGTFTKLAHPDVTAILALAGFDFVVIDMEHAPLGPAEVHQLIGSALGAGLPPLVRVPNQDLSTVGRVLDSGAHGVLVPHVTSARQAAALVDAAQLPPTGSRGFGPTVRAGSFGCDLAGYLRSSEQAVVIPQIEDPDAVAECAAIAETPGIDHVFVGLADLAASTQLRAGHPDLTALLEKIRDTAGAAGVLVGTGVSGDRPPRPPLGLETTSFMTVSNDASLLLAAGRSITGSL